jgi:hypothetical protein
MMSIHATRKLLERIKQTPQPAIADPSTVLGNWYATLLGWRKPVVLFVNTRTRLPVLVSLAPSRSLRDRFADQLAEFLVAHGAPPDFVDNEVVASRSSTWAATSDRSVTGSMNEFAFLADTHRAHRGEPDLLALSVRLAGTPCSPLKHSTGFPDLELAAVIAATRAAGQSFVVQPGLDIR